MDADTFIEIVKPLLKVHGFKKTKATWRKDQDESIAVFNVQKSPWGGGRYYVNIGTYFRALGSDQSPTENNCHVSVRLEVEEPSLVVENAMKWFSARAFLKKAALLAEADSKKGLVFKELRNAAVT